LLGGIIVTKTILTWAEKFGRHFAHNGRRSDGRLGDKWHLDELVVGIAGNCRRKNVPNEVAHRNKAGLGMFTDVRVPYTVNALLAVRAATETVASTRGSPQMDITTLLIIVLIVFLLGGGWYGRGRWY
jgi:putative transposase